MPAKLSALLLAALFVGVAGCDRPSPTDTPSAPPSEDDALLTPPSGFGLGRPLAFLNPQQLALFRRGRTVFSTVFTPETGKGPLFNAASCATCHVSPVVGGIGPQVETHQTAFVGGVCDDLEAIGGQVIQDSATPAFQALGVFKEPLLAEATGTGHRTTPSVLGFGLLEAVPDAEILARADPNDLNHDGISGRAAVSPTGEVGRFGRKDNAATLDEFLAGAFIYEMGVTDADEPDEQTIHGAPLPPGVDPAPDPEITPEDFNAAVSFVRFLAPPPPPFGGFTDRRGRFLFARVGCASCHTPALYTGPNPVRVLSRRVVFAYTDLLLHDMGPDLADICLAQAEPAEFRTEPLMGLRFKTAYLHDGRAHTIDEAIRLHGGEGSGARDRYIALSPAEQASLVRFLSRL